MAGAGHGGPNLVEKIVDVGVVPADDETFASLRLGSNTDGRYVLLIRELVQCALFNSKRNANDVLQDERGRQLARNLGHAGGVLGTARWDGSSTAQSTCDVRQAGSVLEWAVQRDPWALPQPCSPPARWSSDAMASSIGGTADDVDEGLGAPRLQRNQAQQELATLQAQLNAARAELQQCGQQRDAEQRRAQAAEKSLNERQLQLDAARESLPPAPTPSTGVPTPCAAMPCPSATILLRRVLAMCGLAMCAQGVIARISPNQASNSWRQRRIYPSWTGTGNGGVGRYAQEAWCYCKMRSCC